jgi:hypothetical protein
LVGCAGMAFLPASRQPNKTKIIIRCAISLFHHCNLPYELSRRRRITSEQVNISH